MALIIEGEGRFAAPVSEVWAGLHDPATLQKCIPGCRKIEAKSANELHCTVVLSIGPINASLQGKITFKDISPPNSCIVEGERTGRFGGSVKGDVLVELTPLGDRATLVKYKLNAEVGGRVAQLGGRLISATTRKLAAEFFSAFDRRIAAQSRSGVR